MTAHLANTPVIETDDLRLRAPQPGDWPLWQDFALSDRAQYIGGPYSLGTAWRAYCHIVGMWATLGWGSFVITRRDDDTALGMTGPWYPADWPEKELGWTIWSPDHEGRSIAFRAASAARRFAYDRLGWTTAVSYIDAPNARSIALAERLGCVLDKTAPSPRPDADPAVLIYRHPGPEALV